MVMVIKYYIQIKDFPLLLLDKIVHQPIETHELWENITFALIVYNLYFEQKIWSNYWRNFSYFLIIFRKKLAIRARQGSACSTPLQLHINIFLECMLVFFLIKNELKSGGKGKNARGRKYK